MRFTICRIVGNELPPRDIPGSKLDCLKWLLDVDRSPLVRYVYVTNHIVDPHYHDQVMDVLRDEEVVDFPFDVIRMRTNVTGEEAKLHYAISINEARNFGIRYCQQFSDFIACMDQECYFRPEEIPKIIKRIEADQEASDYRRQHYGVMSKRIHITDIPEDLSTVPDCEPMVIVRGDTTKLFDPMLTFGQRDKIALLEWMGYSVDHRGVRHRGDRSRNVGTCIHMSFGDPNAEVDIHHRGNQRALSLVRLMERIDEIYPPGKP